METFTTYYRIGRAENFEWKKAIPVADRETAKKQVEEIRRGGRPARYAKTKMLDIIGLPEVFDLPEYFKSTR